MSEDFEVTYAGAAVRLGLDELRALPAVALAGYTCPSDFGTKALHERLRDARVVSRLSEPHLCLNGNNSQISFNHTLT